MNKNTNANFLEFARKVSIASSGKWMADIFSIDGNTEYGMPQASNGESFELDGILFRWDGYNGSKIKRKSMSKGNPYLVVSANGEKLGKFTFANEMGGETKAVRKALKSMMQYIKSATNNGSV